MPDVFTSSNPVPKKPKTQSSVSDTNSHHIHHLASFCQNPTGVYLADQDADEEILLFLRRHFITNVPWIATTLVLLFIPLFISFFLTSTAFGTFFSLSFLPSQFFLVFLFFYYLIVVTYAFVQFITWFFNVSLVTNKRVIDIDFSDIVYHNVAATKIRLIEDVNYSQTGFIRSFFDYGDVIVQTAGEEVNFDFLAVPHPARVVNIIESLIGEEPK